MKNKFSRPRFESWKTALISSFSAKLIMDVYLLRMCSVITEKVKDFPDRYSESKINYVNDYGWFMYVCFAIIIIADIIMLLRLMFSSRYKPHKKQLNKELNLYRKNSRIVTEKFCFKTMLWLLIPFAFMMGYIDAMVGDMLFLTGLVNAIVYVMILADVIKSSSELKKKEKIRNDKFALFSAASTQYENYSAHLLDEKAVVIDNHTDYMISSFSTGEFTADGMFFYDLDNELIPWLGNSDKFTRDINVRRHHIIIADCKRIDNIENYIRNVYAEFRYNSSKFAYLTIGLVHADPAISEKNFDLGLARDVSVVTFSSYKVLNLSGLVIGKIPSVGTVGTPEENRIVTEKAAKISVSNSEIEAKIRVLLKECGDVSKKQFNGKTEPDFSYAITSCLLDCYDNRRLKNVFLSRTAAFRLSNPERNISNELYMMGLRPDINPYNEYLYSIFKNTLFEPSEVKRIMATFDYIDFMLRTVSIYGHVKYSTGILEDYNVKSTFSDLAQQILNLIPYDDELNESLRKRIDIPAEMGINIIVGSVKEYFNLLSATNSIDFKGLCHLLDIVRNKTRGHGSIKEENSAVIHCFLLLAAEFLHDMLRIREFNIRIENGTTYTGYKSEKYDCSRIIFTKDGLPCIPIRMKGSKQEYINFFKGRYIVPDFIKTE